MGQINPRNDEEQQIDLIIIGAGPAGVSTALHLLQADRSWSERMIVLEKEHHPRHKLCGGGVTLFGLQILKGLAFPMPLPLPQATVEDVQLVYRGRTIHVRGNPRFAIFHRPELDAYLAGEARRRGVDLIEGQPALQLSVETDFVRVVTAERTYLANVVVGADGAKGIVRRILHKDSRLGGVARTLELVSPADPASSLFTGQFARFDFTHVQDHLQGYTWNFPSFVSGQAAYNCGVYDSRFHAGSPRAGLPELLTSTLHAMDISYQKPQGNPLPWFNPFGQFAKPHILVAGDAGGVDPLFGEGIAPALAYGQVAALAVRHAFASGDFSFRSYRRRLLTSPAGRYLSFRWWVAFWSYLFGTKPWFMHSLWTLGDAMARLWPAPGLK